jgi:chemotaxis protein methyltransferase CheR
VWSAGCATGEEPYTLAIILKEMTENQPERITAQVYATDINTAVLEAARRGCYGARAVREVPPQYLSRYFVREGDSWCVVEPLKEMVHFQHLNLLDRTQMRRMRGFDAIFCRNVLIYFDDAARREVALHFYDALVPGGFIFLGHAESMSRITPVFKLRRFANAIIYQK